MESKTAHKESVADSPFQRTLSQRLAAFSCAILSVLIFSGGALAVPSCPEPVLYRQPDGTTFWGRKVGDERRHVLETDAGYTIVKDAVSGVWFYAIRAATGAIERSPFLVGKALPQEVGIPKHLRPWVPTREREPGDEILSPSPASGEAIDTASDGSIAPPIVPAAPKIVKNIVILARFSNHTTIFTRSGFDALFNEIGYSAGNAYGSVKDYYRETSHGHVEIESIVSDWVTLPHEEAYYGANDANGEDVRRQELAEDSIAALNGAGFDFSQGDGDGNGYVDMLTIIHSGLGEEYSGNPPECIWSFMRDLWPTVSVDGVTIPTCCSAPERRNGSTSIIRIGVICHELAHILGLPDLYDTDFSSSGIGVWDVMAAGCWGGDMYSAQRPVHFSAWSKKKLGWVTPTEIDASDSPVTVPQIEQTSCPVVYRISCEMGDREYLLVENRQKRSYDANLPSSGLLVWHIDDNKSDNRDEDTHYMVGLLQADGMRDLENGSDRGDAGDPFPGSTANRSLTPTSNPSSDSYFNGDTYISMTSISDPADEMTFSLSTLVNIYSQDFSGGLPADWTVVDGYSDGYTWTDQNPRSRSNPNWSGVFMIADSAWAFFRSMDEELLSPLFDCSSYSHVRIQFSHCFRAAGTQTGDVDVRVNGGQWQNVARYVSVSDEGLESIDISSYADGNSSVQIHWHFYEARRDQYWGIDNVALRGLPPVNDPPEISISSVSQRRDGSGHVEVSFVGTDPESDTATWVMSDCQFAVYPYSTWQPLSFDSADPEHTADEPMPLTAAGAGFVAVIDAPSWNGSYKIKLRVTDGASRSLPVFSDEFAVDNAAAQVSSATHLADNTPQSGDASVTASSSWSDLNLDATWFSLKVNDGGWTGPTAGSPVGSGFQSATFNSLTIDGDDYLTVKSYHVDAFGNQSDESVSAAYYVVPLVPSPLQVDSPTPSSLVVAVVPNPSENGDVDYAVSCTTVGKYVDCATGIFVSSPVWGNYAQWNGDSGVTVSGLSSHTTYAFRVMAANPQDQTVRSDYSDIVSGTTTNTPPYPPVAVDISPESPVTADDFACSVTPANPPDADSGDTVSYLYTWSCPGKGDVVNGPKTELTDALPASSTSKGDTWTCTVEAYDGFAYSSGIQDSVYVVNSPPAIPIGVSISPDSPRTDDELTCAIEPASPADPDEGDTVLYTYTWSCPGRETLVIGPTSALSDILLAANTTKGDVWTCTVIAADGEALSPEISTAVAVLNSPPTLVVSGELSVYQFTPVDLTIKASDADGDPLTVGCDGAPAGSTFTDFGDGTGTFHWVPTAAGAYNANFTADDGEDQTSEPISISVAPIEFRIVYIGLEPILDERKALAITWFGVPGAVYSVYRSADLATWELVASDLALPPGSGQGDWLSYREELADPSAPVLHYRIGME